VIKINFINMKKKQSAYLFVLVFGLLVSSCKAEVEDKPENTDNPKTDTASEIEFEIIAENLYVPWSIVFTDKERMLVKERNGKLRVVRNGKLQQEPLKIFNDISARGEEGLMGLTLDPDYLNNRHVYVSYAYDNGEKLNVRVVRYVDEGDKLTEEKIITDNIPAERYHAGCRIKFGPDGKLYITTGDAGEMEKVQNIKNLHGKILRINSDGTIPEDNPFTGNPVWSYGHRNPQGIDWYPGTDVLYSTEHGPSGFDGPGGGDEVNIIVKGGNYGWPEVSHKKSKEGMISPVLEFTPAVAPASGMFYKSGVIPEFRNNFFFGCLRGNAIIRVKVNDDNPSEIISHERMDLKQIGRIRDIAEGPDGSIYFSTSNRDGRGTERDGDDKIYRIRKK